MVQFKFEFNPVNEKNTIKILFGQKRKYRMESEREVNSKWVTTSVLVLLLGLMLESIIYYFKYLNRNKRYIHTSRLFSPQLTHSLACNQIQLSLEVLLFSHCILLLLILFCLVWIGCMLIRLLAFLFHFYSWAFQGLQSIHIY